MPEPGFVPLEELQLKVNVLMEDTKAGFLEGALENIPMTIIAGRMDPKEKGDGELVLFPVATLPDLGGSKDSVERMINELTRRGVADVMVVISEAWMIHFDKKSGESREEFDRITNAIYAEYGSLEHHPNRREGLIISAHTRTHDLVHQEVIERDEEGQVRGFEEGFKEVLTREESEQKDVTRSRFRPREWGKRLTLAEIKGENERMRQEERTRRAGPRNE